MVGAVVSAVLCDVVWSLLVVSFVVCVLLLVFACCYQMAAVCYAVVW